MKMHWIYPLSSMVLLCALADASCDMIKLDRCHCQYPRESRFEMLCQHQGLSRMPPNINYTLNNADAVGNFSYNSIDGIPEYYFGSMKFYDSLDFTSNRVSSLTRWSFFNLEGKLQSLNLSNNLLSSVSADTFQELTRLKDLDLSGNQISDPCAIHTADVVQYSVASNRISALGDNCFRYSAKVELLSLADNSITRIDETAFSGMTRLKQLNLDGNRLSDVDKGFKSLVDVSGFERLSLRRNGLESLKSVCTYTWPNIRVLDFGANRLTDVLQYCFKSYNTVSGTRAVLSLELNLEQNQISKISAFAFTGLESRLMILKLNHNRIHTVDITALKSLHRLSILSLDSNELEELMFLQYWQTNTLTDLSVANNKIVRLSPDLFVNMKSLTRFSLKGNRLLNIEDSAFKGMTSLTELILSYNLITNLENGAFDGIDQLKKLRLTGNALVTLKNCSFSKLAGLVEFHFDDNLLHCDCDLQWLLSFVASINGRGIAAADILEPVLEDHCHSPSALSGKTMANVVSANCRSLLSNACFGARVTMTDPVGDDVNITWHSGVSSSVPSAIVLTQIAVDTNENIYSESLTQANVELPVTLGGFAADIAEIYKICLDVTLANANRQKDCLIWPTMIKKPTTTAALVVTEALTEPSMSAGSRAAVALAIILIILLVLLVLIGVYLWRTKKYIGLLPDKLEHFRKKSAEEKPNGTGNAKADPLEFRPAATEEQEPMVARPKYLEQDF